MTDSISPLKPFENLISNPAQAKKMLESIPISLKQVIDKEEVREKKVEMARHLKGVMENYDQFIPFSKKWGIVDSIIYTFKKFIRHVLRLPPPLPLSEMELRFTIHLFRNFDQLPLGLAYTSKSKGIEGLEHQIPFSEVLATWHHFLNSLEEFPNFQKDVDLGALKKCVAVQKEIESARISGKWMRNRKVKGLAEELVKDVKNLKEGEKLYIPGGALEPTSVTAVQMHQMLYEVTRSTQDPSQLVLKVVHTSQALKSKGAVGILDAIQEQVQLPKTEAKKAESPIEEFKVSEEAFAAKLETLLAVQTVGAPKLVNMSLLEKARFLKDGGDLMKLGSTGLSELKEVLQEFEKIEPSEEGHKTQFKAKTDPEKVYETYLKTFQGNSAKEEKMLLKTALFLHIYDKAEEHLSDPHWNKWLKDNAINLLKTIEKRVGLPEEEMTEDLQAVLVKFQGIVEELDSRVKTDAGQKVPKAPAVQAKARYKFSDPVIVNGPILKMDKVQSLKKVTAAEAVELDPVDFSSPETALQEVSEWVKQIKKLSKAKKLEAVQELVDQALPALKANFFEQIYSEDAEKWNGLINQLLRFQVQAFFGLENPCPTPQMLLRLLKTLELVQKLALMSGPEGGFEGYALDMTYYKEMLKDPYLDLGGHALEVIQTIENIEKVSEKRLRLTELSSPEMTDTDVQFYEEFIKDHPDLKIPPRTFLGINIDKKIPQALAGDFGSLKLLPPQVIYVKQALLMSQILFAKYRTLHFWGTGTRIGAIFRAAADPDLPSRKKEETEEERKKEINKAVKRQELKQIDAYFRSQAPLDSFEYVSSDWMKGAGGGMVQLEPYGVRFHDYGKHDVAAPMYAKNDVPIRNGDVRSRVLEGVLADRDTSTNESCSDDGTYFADKNYAYKATGQVASERKILQAKDSIAGLPIDVSAELQLMQSSPEGTRIPLTLGFFIRHPSLFADSKVGRDLQRVFRLNLFRNGALLRKLKKEPEYATPFFRDLKRLMIAVEGSQDISSGLFLMGVYEDIKKGMPENESLEKQCAQNFEKLQSLFNLSEKDPSLFPYRRQINQALLLHYDREQKGDLKSILKAFLALQQMPPSADEINLSAQEAILSLMRRCQNGLKELLLDPAVRDEVLLPFLPEEERDHLHFEPSPEYPVFKAGAFEIDVKRGRVYENQKATTFLPSKITQDSLCLKLFSEKGIFNIRAFQTDVKVGKEIGEQYELTFKSQEFRIVVLPSGSPLIYRESQKGWEQMKTLGSILDLAALSVLSATKKDEGPKEVVDAVVKMGKLKEKAKKDLPLALMDIPCWIASDGKHCTLESFEGTPLFEGELESQKEKHLFSLKRLWEIRGQKKAEILNPWKGKDFEIFKALEEKNRILCTGKKGKINQVKCTRSGIEYKWDKGSKQWSCSNFEGYSLSEKSLDQPLFSSAFTDYHLLQHPFKQSRLLISGEKYELKSIEGVSPHLLKYRRDFQKKVSSDTAPLYIFDVDPLQGLKSETAEGYFYLSYLLYTQGKYAQSLFYMRKAQDVKLKDSQEGERILGYFKEWKDTSANGASVLLALSCIELEQKKGMQPLTLPPLILKYITALISGKVDPALRLSPSQIHTLIFKGVSGALQQYLLNVLQGELDETKTEIDLLKAKIAVNKEKPKREAPKAFPKTVHPIFSPKITAVLGVNPEGGRDYKEACDELSQAFKIGEEVKKGERFQQEMGFELIADFQAALAEREALPQIRKDADLTVLFSDLSDEHRDLFKQAAQKKNEILTLLQIETKVGGFEGLARQLEEYDTLKERYLEETLFAAASGDFSPLIEEKVIQADQIEKLQTLAEEYLARATQSAQYEKAIELVGRLQKRHSDVDLEALAELLAAHRHFDVHKDPYRLPILLMEYIPPKNIARKSQVQNVRDILQDRNVFKHEALAGGKTTMLRNIISKIKADGRVLSGVMTHEPLMGMHHPLYEKTTREAYGERALKVSFKRNDPSDVDSLNLIFRNLLKMIAEKGRISTTRSAILSLHNLLVQKYAELWIGKGDPDVKHAEIDVLGDILEVLASDAAIGNDELEKVTSPDSENNYTAGETKGRVDEIKCEASLKLVEWILSDPFYKPIFQNNKHSKIPENQFTKFRVDMALKVHREYLPDVDADHVVQYLTGVVQDPDKALSFEQLTQFYEENIKSDILRAFCKLLGPVVKGSHWREGGDRFKRDYGGLEVKPAEDGELKVRSEFGSEEEVIWYTCLNYMDQSKEAGVLTEQVERLVGAYKDKASQEILKRLQNDPLHPLDFVNTAAYAQFSEKFGCTLLEATPEACAKIGKKINGDPQKLVEFLRSEIFPHLIVSSEKIVANSQDLPLMFKEFYGSSGTSNNYRALPDPIKKDLALVKQKGVDGAVLANLYKVFEPGDMISLDTRKDLKEQIAGHLQKEAGSTLIDLGPSFPGKSSRAIRSELFPYLKQGTPIRTLNDQNEVQIDPPSAHVEEMITLLGKANCRGTNLVMGANSVGYVTMGPKTTATDFWQAVMRMRKLGKGQKVKYLLDPALEPILGRSPSLGQLVAFLYRNEAEILKNQAHLKSEKQKISSIGKCELFKQLRQIKDRALRMEASAFRPFFFKPSQESLDSCGRPKEEKPTVDVITQLAMDEKGKLEKLVKSFEPYPDVASGIKEACINLDQKIKGEGRISSEYLPDTTPVSSFDLGMEQEVEKEQEQEQEMEAEQMQEVSQELQTGEVPAGYEWKPLNITTPEDFIDHILKDPEKVKPLKDTVKAYDPTFYLTTNLYRDDRPWGQEGPKEKVAGQDVMLRSTFLVDRRAAEIQVHTVFGAIKDYDHELEALSSSSDIDVYHLNMLTGEFDGRKATLDPYPIEVQQKIARSIALAKFFAGQVDLISPPQDAPLVRKETAAFEDWLKGLEKGDVLQLESNLKKYLSEYKQSVAPHYSKSEMAKVFRRVFRKVGLIR